MSVAERIHGAYVHDRRTRVLCGHLSDVIPEGFRVLDVGCGDGLLARLIVGRRPDLALEGIDVLVREGTHVPVTAFDGHAIPHPDASFDAVQFVDVLHHTDDPEELLREAVRVARRAVVIKDHTLEGLLAGPTLRTMDRVGNARHDVAMPHTYWRRERWLATFDALGLTIGTWRSKLGLYPWPASWIFGRRLHFVARLDLS